MLQYIKWTASIMLSFLLHRWLSVVEATFTSNDEQLFALRSNIRGNLDGLLRK